MERIVSLLPSLTEIACALGLEARLVGRSHECDHPAAVSQLPILTAPKLDASAGSRAIDDRVKQLVGEGISIYQVDAERLRALAPDVILTQDHCEVCAASLSDVEEALAAWVGKPPRVVSVAPSTLADIWRSIHVVADACGAREAAVRLTHQLTDRLTELGEKTGGAARRPSVACIEWLDPLMAGGNWLPELVAIAGGRSVLATQGAHSPWLEWSALQEADPDVIVLLPCGFDLARTAAELPVLTEQPAWNALRAVKDGRVYLADGNQYMNRPGPRIVDSAELLAEILHPERCAFGHRGSGFVALADANVTR